MELTNSLKSWFIATAQSLQGSARRLFMARTGKELGPSGQRRAERDLGWSRMTIRQGTHELTSGITCLEALAARGRTRAEAQLPSLLSDIKAIVDSQRQADPQFRTTRRRQCAVNSSPTKAIPPTCGRPCQPSRPN